MTLTSLANLYPPRIARFLERHGSWPIGFALLVVAAVTSPFRKAGGT